MKIAYFSPIAFDFMKQRPQHIAELLSKTHEIYYIEPTVSLLKYLVRREGNWRSLKHNYTSNLHVIRANGAFTLPRFLEAYNLTNINTFSEFVQLKAIIDECDMIWVGDPSWFNLIKRFSEKELLYDKMDDHGKLTQNKLFKKLVDKNEKELVQRAKVLLASCEIFYQDFCKHEYNAYLIRNGVSIDFAKNQKKKVKKNNNRIFGYVGAIGHWFDFRVLEVILKQDENNEIVLVGENMMPVMEHPRIHYIGKIEKSMVPIAISHFDVCLYNFKQNDLLDTINPVKIYEYLSMNKPVLAVRSVETETFYNQVMLYTKEEEIANYLEANLKRPFSDDEEIEHFLQENSWEQRVKIIETLLMDNFYCS